MPPTLIQPNQINYRALFSVESVLAARGLKVKKAGALAATMLGPDDRGSGFYDFFYEQFSNSDVRYKLLQICEGNLNKDCSGLADNLVNNLLLDRQKFSYTIEWFIGEVLIREYRSFSSAFGVEIFNLSDAETSRGIGDFDVISVLRDSNLLYVECKSGATGAVEISQASRRGRLLGAVATVVALDRKTGNFDKLREILSDETHPLLGVNTTPYRVSSFKLPNSEALGWGNVIFLPLAAPSLKNSLSTILRLVAKMKLNPVTFEVLFTGAFENELKRFFNDEGFEITW